MLSHGTKELTLASIKEAQYCFDTVVASAETTKAKLAALLASSSGLELLHELKFKQAGTTPFNDASLNLIEQLNQAFTYLTSFVAVGFLLREYAQFAPFKVNLGTSSGFDIESEDGVSLAAEVFAATHPDSNQKLSKDAKRLEEKAAAYLHRFAFYYSPKAKHSQATKHYKFSSVVVIPILEFSLE